MDLNSISSQQENLQKNNEIIRTVSELHGNTSQRNNKILKPKMILIINPDAKYLTKEKVQSRIGGQYFLGILPIKIEPININDAIHIMCSTLTYVSSSSLEE